MGENGDCKKIVFLIGSMSRGGAERVISILANNYADRGWKVDILMLLDNQCMYVLNANVRVIPICNKHISRFGQLPKWIYYIRRYVIDNNPDRIISFIARINLITILSCMGLNNRIIISERNDPTEDGRTKFVRFATRLLYPHANCVIFQTKWAQSCFSKRIQNNSVIIPNPIYVTTEASSIKGKKIVAVGRLSEQKNHTMLINAFKKIHDIYPEYKLYIYGEGKLRNTLIKQIQSLGLDESVFLPGNVSNIHEKIADAEVFVLSSNYEGLSNALLEAMMMGLPCISTNCAGSNEVIRNNKNGLIIPIGDTDKLVEAMKQLINNKEFSNEISKEAKVTSRVFDSKNIINKWEAIIENNSNIRSCEMKRILFIIPFLSSGGAERVVSIWCSKIAKLGGDVHLLVFYRVDNEYPLNDKVVLHTIKEDKLEYDKMTHIEKLKAMRSAFKKIKPYIVLPFITHVGLMASVAKIGLHVNVVETIRIDPRYSPHKRLIRWLRNISVFFSKRCIVQNKAQLEYFPKCMHNRMLILPNPISEEFIKKEKIFVDKQIKNIIAVGRLEKQKNYHMLISAFSHIAKNNKEVNLSIYGEGSQYNVLKDYIYKLNLIEQVLLCGRTNNMADVLLKSDLFILSSEAEGMPNSLMEAMAVGLPCISTNCPTGPADLISDGINGYLISVGNEKALIISINKMIKDIDLSIAMGKRARESILNQYGSDVSAKEFMKFIENFSQNHEIKKFKREAVVKRYPKIIQDIFNFIRFSSFQIWPEFTLKEEFKRHTGYKLNLKDPKTYNEKLQWLMLYWFDPQATICVDKYLVRQFVEDRGLGHLLNDLYCVYDNVEDIKIESLPNEFVIKVNHGCGQNLICTDKSNLNWKLQKKNIKKWLKRNQFYYSLEWVYKNIKPKIIVEKLIKTDDSKLPKDYKVFCFDGKPRYILVASERGNGTTKFDFFDIDWNHISVLNHYPNSEDSLPKPKKLDKILEYSNILSAGFPHMRVDFYIEQDKVIFGECTFFHFSGKKAFEPSEFDYEMGRYLDLSKLKTNYKR